MISVEGLKYRWLLPEVTKEVILKYAQDYNLSYAIAQTLLGRGHITKDDFDSYLFTSYEKDVAHPSLLKDAQKAVDRILEAIKNGEKILICGDYDVDGITSSAMMMICLLPLGAKINYFLPNRKRDGYGLSAKIVNKAAANDYKVLITVDNGISAFEAGLEAKKHGIDLIITDHHRPHEKLPEAYAVVDPHQEDCEYPYKKFAGVGVSFKILSLLYEMLGKELPEKVYELLLLGTVADVVPLTGENRFWVRHGLQLINSTESFSVKVLKDNAKVNKPALTSLDIGFFLAPQINALGRLEDARQGVRFLVGAHHDEVVSVGAILKQLNEARKAIEKQVLGEIIENIEKNKEAMLSERVIISSSKDWQAGVIGLIASRVVGAYNRPTLLFHITKDGIAKGSCRSIPELNMFEILEENKDILISFGGHAMAAGLALPVDKLDLLKERLEKTVAKKIPVMPDKASIGLDAELALFDVNKKLVADMAYLEPFGNENNQPVFYLKDVSVVGQPTLLKGEHVKCMVFSDGIIKPLIFFSRPDIYDKLLELEEASFSCAVKVLENHFNGKVSIELQGIDIAV